MLVALLTTVALTAAEPTWDPASTWTVTTGVLSWKDSDLADFSTYKRKDKELDATFRARGVPDAQRILLIDRAATTEAVLRAIGRQLIEAPRGSTFVFYFTGHGVRDDTGELVLTTTDTRMANIGGTGLHAVDLLPLYLLRGPSDRVILISDACLSGDLAQLASTLTILGVPSAALTSAASQSESTGDWTFTQTIIDALRGRATIDADGDGAITAAELAAEAKSAMKYREGQPTAAMLAGVGASFVLAKAEPWPDDLAALDVKGDVYGRGDWVLARRPDGGRDVARVLGAERVAATNKKRPATTRLRLSFFGYADETFGWAREDRVQPIVFEQFPVGARLRIEDDEDEYQAVVLKTAEDLHFVHYDGYEDEEDEWVTPDQILGLWEPDDDDPRWVEVDGREAWKKAVLGDKVCVRYPSRDWEDDECVAADRVRPRSE